jgi:hypothetical protein
MGQGGRHLLLVRPLRVGHADRDLNLRGIRGSDRRRGPSCANCATARHATPGPPPWWGRHTLQRHARLLGPCRQLRTGWRWLEIETTEHEGLGSIGSHIGLRLSNRTVDTRPFVHIVYKPF